jgi:hypothetical protein
MVDYAALRSRLWDVNIEYSALVRSKGEDRLARMAQLRAERKTLMALLAGEAGLRLVSENQGAPPELPVAHRQSA